MADKRITNLPFKTDPTLSDEMHINDVISNFDKKILLSVLRTLFQLDQDVRIDASPTFNGIKTDNVVLKTKVIEIGDWDMDTDSSKSVSHSIPHIKIRQVTAIIQQNENANARMISQGASAGNTTPQGSIGNITDTTVALLRLTGGSFDGILYNATSFNRGWVIIQYEV